ILCFALVVFLLLASADRAGVVGEYTFTYLSMLLGVGYFLLPVVFLGIAISFFRSIDRRLGWGQVLSAVIFVVAGLGIIDMIVPGYGGMAGGVISTPLLKFFEITFSLILLFSL